MCRAHCSRSRVTRSFSRPLRCATSQRALRILTGAFGYCPDGPFQLIVAQVYKANVDERECTEVLARASSTVPSWTRESNAYQRVVRSAPDYPAFG